MINGLDLNEILEMLFLVVSKFEFTTDSLIDFLPYIEGILIDRPETALDIAELCKTNKENLISSLLRIIRTQEEIYDKFFFDFSVRILTRIFSK